MSYIGIIIRPGCENVCSYYSTIQESVPNGATYKHFTAKYAPFEIFSAIKCASHCCRTTVIIMSGLLTLYLVYGKHKEMEFLRHIYQTFCNNSYQKHLTPKQQATFGIKSCKG